MADAPQWPVPGEVPAPMNGSGLAPAPATTSVGPGWATGTPGAPIDPRSQNGVSWVERNDVEYWLPDNLHAQVPVFDFPGTNVYLRPSLPSIVQGVSDTPVMEHHHPAEPSPSSSAPISNILSQSPGYDRPRSVWPSSIIETNMIPWIDVYFDRLHPTLPVLNRSSMFIRMLSQEHRQNPQFGAMLLSLCAFSLTQPIEIDERPTSSSRANQARSMMHEATKMRSCSDFGENPTIEAVLTSFFLFGCLFGSNQHNAAWLRLREALDLAATLGLNDPNSYLDLSSEEKGQRLRTYLVLSITERAYALQRRHPITFRGKPGFSMRSVHEFIHGASHRVVSGIIVHNEHDAEGMMGLARLMELFDAIDEDVVDCWNRRCNIDNNGYCERLTAAKALIIHQNLARVSFSERYKGYDWFERTKATPNEAQAAHQAVGLKETQCADIFITQKWLQNRLWVLCLTHGLLGPVLDRPELTFNYAIFIANEALQICKSLRISSMEAHGIGLVEKLFDIATSAINIFSTIDPSLGANFPLTSSNGSLAQAPSTTATTATVNPVSLSQGLAADYLLLLSSLRGGNHPFLERFKEYLGTSSTSIISTG